MTSDANGPVIGFESPLAATPHATEPRVVPGNSGLPVGYPRSVDTQLAWVGDQFKNDHSYIYRLSGGDIAEAESALVYFKTLELDGNDASPDNFPLPTLGPKLKDLANDVYHGRGFCVIRGLDLSKYSVEDSTVIWLGIQGYIARQQGRQDKNGNMLVHIHADKSTEIRSEHHRHSTNAITFHTEEAGDVIGWLTRSAAASGGNCIIASGHTVYNVLAAARPDLIRVLARSDWPFALPRFQCRPIFFAQDSNVMINFGRTPLLGSSTHPRPKQLPSLSAHQLEALDAIEAIARATEMKIQTQPGDMHYINNLAILHRRDAFANGDDQSAKRHLIRMRLRNESLGPAIPNELKQEWTDAFEKKGDQVWHLEPMPEGFFPLRMYTN